MKVTDTIRKALDEFYEESEFTGVDDSILLDLYKKAYNQALEDASENAEVDTEDIYAENHTYIVDKDSILKLKL